MPGGRADHPQIGTDEREGRTHGALYAPPNAVAIVAIGTKQRRVSPPTLGVDCVRQTPVQRLRGSASMSGCQ